MRLTTFHLALGSNLGDRRALLGAAREALRQTPGIELLASSGLYLAEPCGGPPGQEAYYNAVLQGATSGHDALELLHLCRQVEERFGRVRGVRWGARTLDIDLLFFGDLISDDPQLLLPHPRLHLRGFVLRPLLDLAPELRHPRLRRTIRELFLDLPAAAEVRLLDRDW